MAAPIKPWEANYRKADLSTLSNEMAGSTFQDRLQSATGGVASPVSNTSFASTPPQLPPRPSEQTSSLCNRLGYGGGMYGTGGYNSMYGGYGGIGGYSGPLGYGGMYNSPYSSYGGYYNGYNRMGGDMNSSFARFAEESSRPAFESINSIVQVVNSVGMMLDSTFQAVYNSFRAVIGVADNFSRLKSQLIQIFSALAFIRSLKYFLRKILEILRLRPRGNADRLWSEAVREAAATVALYPDGGPAKSSWPIILFFGIIMGGPYLIWKLLSAFSGTSDENAWARGEVDHFEAVSNFNFQGQGAEELSFSAGQTLKVSPKELQPRVRGWLLASADGKTTGMIPANYVKILGKKRGTAGGSPMQPQPQPQPMGHSASSPAFTQTSQWGFPSTSSTAIPDSQLESAFSVPFQESDTVSASSNVNNVSGKDASEILTDS
ncbi:hypothetical protein EGW08_007101 [Elysia chlorotica]|uniref:Peroxisomal membrane protein PEX13 n=1 Tax=Elysia chlorotica TaxID=188477 RepID=A0A433TU98_ELYCH|nr:hypothetical protein EGW08_007101 [Elysia chlorotica]